MHKGSVGTPERYDAPFTMESNLFQACVRAPGSDRVGLNTYLRKHITQ